jgi:hypothetical protein
MCQEAVAGLLILQQTGAVLIFLIPCSVVVFISRANCSEGPISFLGGLLFNEKH